MKKKDVIELQAVCGVYSMAHYLSELLDETYDDLPDIIDSCNLRDYLKDFLCQLDDYQYKIRYTFLSVCEDDTD
jgi:hypothetical protein